MEKDEHLWWIDSAKGIGVILIVVGHLLYDSSHSEINKLIYSFHVPMFFIISGMLYKTENVDKKILVLRKFKRLIIPFLAFTLLGSIRIIKDIGTISINEIFRKMFFLDGEIYFNLPLWFLVVLFEIYMVEILIGKWLDKSLTVRCISLLGFFILGLVLYNNKDNKILNLFGFNKMIICLLFFMVGVALRRIISVMKKSNKTLSKGTMAVVIVPIMLLSVYLSSINGKISIYSVKLGTYMIFVPTAILGSLTILIICKLFLDKKSVLSKLNKYSILIMGCQYFVIMPYREKMKQQGLSESFWYDIGTVIVTVFITICVPYVYKCLSKHFAILKVLNGEYK